MATFVFIDDTPYLTDTLEQIEAAKAAMQEAGITETEVWSGDPDDEHSESVLNGQILFADPAEEKQEADTVPLCRDCVAKIGGATGEPIFAWHAADGEPCGAADHGEDW